MFHLVQNWIDESIQLPSFARYLGDYNLNEIAICTGASNIGLCTIVESWNSQVRILARGRLNAHTCETNGNECHALDWTL